MGFDPLSPTIPQVLNFLQSLREEPSAHRGYSAICTVRSALSSFLDKSLIDNNFMKQFIRGFYNQDPPRVRYSRIWDPKNCTGYVSRMGGGGVQGGLRPGKL